MGFWDSATQGFNSGFAYAEDKQRADREFALKKQLHDANMQEAALRLGALRRVDDATARLTEAQSVGLRVPEAIKAQDDDFEAASAAALKGQALPAYNAQTWNAPVFRKASERELLGLERGLATARGDLSGIREVRQQTKDLDWQDALKAGGQAYMKLSPEQKAEWWKTQSYDQSIPAFGTYVKDAKTGYVSFQPEGKPAVRLSADEEMRLYAARQAYDTDPERAMTILMSGSATLRGLAKDISESQGKGAQVSNTGQHYFNTDTENNRHNQAMERLKGQEIQVQRDRFNHDRTQIVNPQLNYSVVNGKLVPTITGLKYSTLTGKHEAISLPLEGQNGIIPASQFDPAKMEKAAEALVGTPYKAANGQMVKHTMQTAQQAVIDQIIRAHTGGAGTSNDLPDPPPAPSRSPAAAPVAAPASAPGRADVSNLSDDQLRAALKQHGALGYKEALLGPQPGVRNGAGLREWNARSQALDSRLQSLFARPSN